jgi:hypothetical protein
MHRILAPALFAFALFVFGACDGDEGDDGATSTAPTGVTPSATATVPAGGIRSLDLQSSEPVQDLIDVTGGLYVQDNVLYADLTNDGEDEAVVPVASGGTLGDVGVVVLRLVDTVLEPILTLTPEGTGGLSVSVSGGQLATVEPVPGPDDPECCPSQLRTTTYRWDGAALVVESSVVASAEGTAPEAQ